MAKNTLYLIGILLTLSCLYSCKSKTKKWDNIANSIKKWENFELQIKGIKAPFPKRPVQKSIAYSSDISFHQSYAEIDSVTFSVAIITNAALKDAKSWHDFFTKEVLAFKSLEQKNIKVLGRDAVWSKVRENDLCSYTINMVVDNNFVLNLGLRYKGDFPPEKLMMDFASRLKIEKYQLPSIAPPVVKDSILE